MMVLIDAFQYAVNTALHKRIRSTNLLDRLSEEIRRREKVIRIFPNEDSATRLIGAILIDKHEEMKRSSAKSKQFTYFFIAKSSMGYLSLRGWSGFIKKLTQDYGLS